MAAFNRSKSDTGWSVSAIKVPEALQEKTPKINHSKWLSEDEDGNEQLALNDESGAIVVVLMSKAGTVKGLFFKES